MRAAQLLGIALTASTAFASPGHSQSLRRSRSRHQRDASVRSLAAVESAMRVRAPTAPEAQAQALVARDEATGGHWSVVQSSTWVADASSTTATGSSIDTAGVAVETVYVTVTVEGDDSSALSTATSAASTDTALVDLAGVTSSSSYVASESSASSYAASTTSSAATSSLADSSNPIDTFVSSTSTDDLDLSISLGATISLGGAATTTSTGIASSVTSAVAASTTSSASANTTSSSSSKKVFAHFMVGIVSTYTSSDWEADMTLAKSKEIDGFALNIGTDAYSQTQLDLAYAAAESVGFQVFISFDFNWYTTSNVSGVADMLKRYVSSSAQFKVDGKAFVSTFIGDGFDWASTASEVGEELYAVPFWEASQANADNSGLSGLFSWAAWPGQENNVPVNTTMDDSRDLAYLSYTDSASKTYMAPVSTWFSTHFGTEVSYSKNWVFKSETLWKDRWDQVLSLGSQLNFVEIVTWNDYGESHYIGPYNTPHTDDGSSKWASGLDHTAMLDFAVPYIKAFKAGQSSPTVEQEMLVYWYRPHLKSASCDSTDNCGSKPTGWDFLSDSVFVATMTTSGGSVSVTSGSSAAVAQTVEAGVQVFEVPMGVGTQSFTFQTNAGGSGSGSANVTISADCWNGIYNFNFHSGSITV